MKTSSSLLLTWAACGLVVAALYLAPGCAHLTVAEEQALLAADTAACTALVAVPTVGPLVALACPGEELALRVALDHAVAASSPDAGADAGPGVAASALTVLPTIPAPRVAVHRRSHGHRHLVGYVPAELHDGCQAALDAQADAGSP